MNDQCLKEAILSSIKHAYYNSLTDDVALKNGVIPNKNHALKILEYKADEIMEFIKQNQSLREIDIRIEELEELINSPNGNSCYKTDNSSVFNGEIIEFVEVPEIEERIAELQAQKYKLIKGVE